MNMNINMYEILTILLFQSRSYKKFCVVYSSITVSSGALGLFVSTKPKKLKKSTQTFSIVCFAEKLSCYNKK